MNSEPPCKALAVGAWIRADANGRAQGDAERQEARAREYARSHGWSIREIYSVNEALERSVAGHAEAKRMLADVRRHHISALIVTKFACVSGDIGELFELSDCLRAAGADLVSLEERIDTSTPPGRQFLTTIAAMAQWEREEAARSCEALFKDLPARDTWGFVAGLRVCSG